MGKMTVSDGTVIPGGTYKVKFAGISSREDGKPIAKQTDKGLKIYMDLKIADGAMAGEMVPASTDLEGIASWCMLFSGKQPVSKNLADIEAQMQSDKVVDMAVTDKGWARGPMLPKGTYMAKFAQFAKREDGKPVLGEGEYKGDKYEKVFWQFEVVAGGYQGIMAPASCPYPVKVKSGSLELSSKSNFFAWCVACGVDFGSTPDFADMKNTLPELEEVMQGKGRVLVIQVGDTGWVESGQGAVVAAPDAMKPVGTVVEEKTADKVGDLYIAIRKICEDHGLGDPFNKDGNLSDVGKKFAGEHIGPICVAHGIPRAFTKMSDAQAEAVKNELLAKFGKAEPVESAF